MIKIFKLAFGSLGLLSLSIISACSSFQDEIIDNDQNESEVNGPHTCDLILKVSKSGYNDEPFGRSTENWVNGDKIYLTFSVGSGTSYGDAIYYNGTWSVNYYGSLTQGTKAACKAVYFENAEYESSSNVCINENTTIYEDTIGSYYYNNGAIQVIADLKPKTGRIRFAGTENDKISLYGISHFTNYDYSKGKYSSSISAINTKVTSEFTPYIYGVFSDLTEPRINIITAQSGFTRILSTSIYGPGESGYMTIPTETAHNGWQNSVILKVNGVEFTMIPVTYYNGNFLLAETETTEQLYSSIIATASKSSQYPQYGVSYSNWEIFLQKLNAFTELNFRIPTLAEWQYAFQGGNKSKGYTYSGSNILSNVAWYVGNSGGSSHPVKQLQPNELGFYDMSGNVYELVKTGTGSSSSYYNFYGGYWSADESKCKVSGNVTYNWPEYSGLRIALSNLIN